MSSEQTPVSDPTLVPETVVSLSPESVPPAQPAPDVKRATLRDKLIATIAAAQADADSANAKLAEVKASISSILAHDDAFLDIAADDAKNLLGSVCSGRIQKVLGYL